MTWMQITLRLNNLISSTTSDGVGQITNKIGASLGPYMGPAMVWPIRFGAIKEGNSQHMESCLNNVVRLEESHAL
jgi:hypothetical protein